MERWRHAAVTDTFVYRCGQMSVFAIDLFSATAAKAKVTRRNAATCFACLSLIRPSGPQKNASALHTKIIPFMRGNEDE